ncbi:MAG: hypothetical protein JNM23_04785 [Bradyrhizobiaceae bacterium]|nr:hypothetical protein [Bradyrhizobiaceae bacterium]
MNDAFNISGRFEAVLAALLPTIEGLGLWIIGAGTVMIVAGLVLRSREPWLATLTFRGVGLVCLGMIMMGVSVVL